MRGGRASSMGRSKAGKTFEQKAGFRGKRYGGFRCRTPTLDSESEARYLSKVKDAGGIERYERAHLASRAATFIPKLAHLPPELVRRVVEYWMHAGDY